MPNSTDVWNLPRGAHPAELISEELPEEVLRELPLGHHRSSPALLWLFIVLRMKTTAGATFFGGEGESGSSTSGAT